MAPHALSEDAIARAIKRHLGASVYCHRVGSSSSGGVFLVQHKTGKWIAKVFSNQERNVAVRTIHVLRQLNAREFAAPRLVCDDLVQFGEAAGYLYEYIVGPCLRDEEQTLAAYQATGRLISQVSGALRECWDEGGLPDLFDKFDLDCQLDQGVRFLLEVSRDLADEARQRLSNWHQISSSADLKPMHADLHMGNVILTERGPVAIDFDSMYLSRPEKAFAALVGKIYEQDSLAKSRRALIEAVIIAGESGGVELDLELLQLCAMEKKLGEMRYLNSLKSHTAPLRSAAAGYSNDAMRGLIALLREWEQFPTRLEMSDR